MLDLVGNPEDWSSGVAVHIMLVTNVHPTL